MNRIRKLRMAKKVTQQIFADNLNVDRTTVSKWETNKSSPYAEKLKEVADYFDVTTDYLLGRNSNPPYVNSSR